MLYLYQLPQNLLGLLVILLTRAKRSEWDGITYYDGRISGAVTLSMYIIIDRRYYNDSKTIHHEYGHQMQSKYLGWFYLIVIGLPSVIGNLLNRVWHFNYYSQPWEAWADRFGGVER